MCILNPHSNELRWGIEKGGVLKSTRIMTQKNRKMLREKIELEWSRNRILGSVFGIVGYVKLTYPDIFFWGYRLHTTHILKFLSRLPTTQDTLQSMMMIFFGPRGWGIWEYAGPLFRILGHVLNTRILGYPDRCGGITLLLIVAWKIANLFRQSYHFAILNSFSFCYLEFIRQEKKAELIFYLFGLRCGVGRCSFDKIIVALSKKPNVQPGCREWCQKHSGDNL